MKPYTTSASQISTAEDCLRKWGFQKIAKIETPPNRYAQFGSETHAHMEAWFKSLTVPPDTPTGRAAQALIPHLPPPQTKGLEVEQKIMMELGGVPLVGYVDLRNLAIPVPFISDHKTTSGFHWIPDDWKEDIQATIYAADAMIQRDALMVDCQWTYVTRDKIPKTKPVKFRLTYAGIKPRVEKSMQTALVLRDAYNQQIDPMDLPYDATACAKYGGCPFKHLCKLTPQERIKSVMSQESAKEKFLAKLAAKRAEAGGSVPQPPASAPSAPEPVSLDLNPPEQETPPPAATEAAAATDTPLPKTGKKARSKKKAASKKRSTKKAPEPQAPPAYEDTNGEPAPAESVPETQPVAARVSESKTKPVARATDTDAILDAYRKGFNDGFEKGRSC